MPAGLPNVKARFPQASNAVANSSVATPTPSQARPTTSIDGTTNRAPATLATITTEVRVVTSRSEFITNTQSGTKSESNITLGTSTRSQSGTNSEPSVKPDSTPTAESSLKSESSRKVESDKKTGSTQTPTFFPTASYLPVQVVPASELPPTITHSSIPRYEGSNAIILKGYCTEPGYTILDGPTVLWVPVIGCLSSKAECCPTPTAGGGGNAVPTPDQQNVAPSLPPSAGAGQDGKGAFPVSSLPSQDLLTGCPLDYHTVTGAGGAACCPSSYWLWSTQLGGQVPCYSALGEALVPPPIPDTLVNVDRMTETGSLTTAPSSRPSTETMPKPTSAVVNIAYAMQYKLAADPERESTGMKKEAKVGIGAGVVSVSLLVAAVLGFFLWRRIRQKKSKNGLGISNASERFDDQIDMTRLLYEHPGVARTHGGVKYAGVSTRPSYY